MRDRMSWVLFGVNSFGYPFSEPYPGRKSVERAMGREINALAWLLTRGIITEDVWVRSRTSLDIRPADKPGRFSRVKP